MISVIKQLTNRPFFNKSRNISILYFVVAIVISCKIFFLETWDNYDCFRASFGHLTHQLDLYLPYPAEYQTLYNYSPSFAAFMGLYAQFPDGWGILLWNLTHTLTFIFAVNQMPIDEKKKVFLLWFCLIEFITAAENVQTNASVAGLILLIFIFQQKGKTSWSSLFFALGFFFKIYVVTAGVFFICFQKRLSFVWKAIAWSLLFFSIPLLFVSFNQLIFLYQSWAERLLHQSERHSLSLLGIIDLLHIESLQQGYIMLAGLITMLLVLFKKEVYQNLSYQLLYLAAILQFTIVFNPGVESPSYIIAIPGVALWYLYAPQASWRKYLLMAVFVFTCLSPTEVFPRIVRDQILNPLHVKAIPVIITWFVCIFDLFNWKQSANRETPAI
ncbi:MAG: DUF2029 domain-containing protein [Sediminibacterium sp.]|nr:DUF2029 domain-containing protein [Sediminibacterium sp.]